MATVNDIFENLTALAPMELAVDYDNPGLLIGDRTKEVRRCLLALDITGEVIGEAAAFGAQLIVSHHPVIFKAQKSVLTDDAVGKRITGLIRNDLAAICMHTNLDIAEGGVNDALIAALGCKNVISALDEYGCGRIGEYDESIPFTEFLQMSKTALKTSGLRYVSAGLPVKRLAVMGGAGGDCVELAKSLGCDTYLTADIKYNYFLDAKEIGLNLIDADHFCTENVVMPLVLERLTKAFPAVEFKISEKHEQTVRFA